MSNLTPFSYSGQQVRVVTIDGEPWFVLTDLCRVLDLSQPHRVATRIADDMKGRHQVTTPGGPQDVTIVSEAGMYEVVIRSDKPEAVAFRRWITSDVLPAIRRTGSYGVTPELTGKALLAAAVLEAAETIRAHEATIAEQRAELAAAAPKVHAWDGIISGVGDYTITDAAKVLARAGVATGPRKLHHQMLQLGWLYKNQRDRWTAKQNRVNDGCLAERACYYTDEDGVSTLATPQVRVTAKGLEKLRDALAPQPMLAAVTA